MTYYVTQMSAAWHAFAAGGRARHPGLRVVFAMLAGLGPLHAERLAARGGPPRPSTIRSSASTARPTARAPSTRCCGWSASTGSSTAPIARSIAPPDARVLGEAVEYALTTGNPDLVFGAAAVAE